MASDEKDNANGTSGADDAPGSSKRPTRIIELEVEEVEIEIKAGEDEEDDRSGVDESTGEAGKQSPPPPPVRPPQRTRPSDVKGFVTHLAAGLIGGLVGVVGAGIALDKLSLPGLTGGSEIPEQIARVQQRQSALDEKLEGVAKTDALDKFEARLSAVENKPEASPAEPRDLADRLAKLEDTLKTLISSAGEEGASGLEPSAALNARIDALSSDLEARNGALKNDIAEMKKTLQTRVAPQGPDSGPAMRALGERLDAFEKKVTALAARPLPAAGQAIAAQRPGADGAALALAFESLRRGVESGEAFTSQLDALAKLAPDGLDLSALASHAATGAETSPALLRALPAMLREARIAAAKSDDDTFFARLMSNARSVLRVRRVGPVEGESAQAVLARMEARMKASDMAGVLREAEGLSGPALDAMKPWLGKARSRQASGAGLAALEKNLLASLKPDMGARR